MAGKQKRSFFIVPYSTSQSKPDRTKHSHKPSWKLILSWRHVCRVLTLSQTAWHQMVHSLNSLCEAQLFLHGRNRFKPRLFRSMKSSSMRLDWESLEASHNKSQSCWTSGAVCLRVSHKPLRGAHWSGYHESSCLPCSSSGITNSHTCFFHTVFWSSNSGPRCTGWATSHSPIFITEHRNLEPDMAMYVCDSSPWEAGAGRFYIPGHSGLRSVTLSWMHARANKWMKLVTQRSISGQQWLWTRRSECMAMANPF